MATNLVYRNIDSLNRVRDLGATTAPGTAVIIEDEGPAVAVTGSGDYTISEEYAGIGTLSGIPAGGASLEGTETTVAFDGTWEFDDITGADAETIEDGTVIYITGPGELDIAGTDRFGIVDRVPDYDKTRGFVPVKIGA